MGAWGCLEGVSGIMSTSPKLSGPTLVTILPGAPRPAHSQVASHAQPVGMGMVSWKELGGVGVATVEGGP